MDESMNQVDETTTGACLSLDEATCKAASNMQVAVLSDEDDDELDEDEEDQMRFKLDKRPVLGHSHQVKVEYDDLVSSTIDKPSVSDTSPNNLYTFRKTEWDVKKMENYVRLTFNDSTTMDKMEPHLLNTYLKSFFEFAKKSDGMEYEPESLIGFMNSYERYLKTKNYPESLLRSDMFKESRAILKNKRELVRSVGKLIRTKTKDTAFMLQYYKNILKEKGLLSRDNPDALLAEIYLNNTIYFGEFLKEDKAWRGNLNLVWGDILLECDPENGLEYLTLSITIKKSSSHKNSHHQLQPVSSTTNRVKTGTHTSKLRAAASTATTESHNHHELSSPRIYAREPHNLCAVEAYKLFRSRRPATCLDRESPFYLAPNSKSKFTSKVWYKALAMSCQRLDALFYCLFKKANMDMQSLMTMQDEEQRKMIDLTQSLDDVVVWKSNKPVSASTTPITITQYHPPKQKKSQNSSSHAQQQPHSHFYPSQQSDILATVPVQVQVQVQIQVQSRSQQQQIDFNNNKSLPIY